MSQHVASWGIIGTGWIASKFAGDLAISNSRDGEFKHSISAVASRDIAKADLFVDQQCLKGRFSQWSPQGVRPRTYGSYAQLYADEAVEIVYIATLNPTHYTETKAALNAGKHCLVEKPATLNAAEWYDLMALAKKKHLFLMEGMWTRFLPIIPRLQEVLFEKKSIGEIRGVQANFGMNLDAVSLDSRTLARSAAGGALFDLGPYAIFYNLLVLQEHPGNDSRPPAQISSVMIKGPSDVDITTSISMTFPNLNAVGIATASMTMTSSQDARCIITGTDGEVVIRDGLSRTTTFAVRRTVSPNFPLQWHPEEVVEESLQGFGLIHEANEVARCLRNGCLESDKWPHRMTLDALKLIDRVRKQNQYDLPDGLEKIKIA